MKNWRCKTNEVFKMRKSDCDTHPTMDNARLIDEPAKKDTYSSKKVEVAV